MAKEIYSNSKKARRNMQAGRPVKRRKRRNPLKFICISVVTVCVLAVAGMAFWNSSLFSDSTDTNAGLDNSIGTITEEVINILILGIDTDDDTSRDVNNLTDTIMVASFRVNEGTVTVLQIPRDTFVGEEYTATGKINALYSSKSKYSGIDGLAQYIYDNFCIPIDHYATITMNGFRTAIDKIGGIEIQVPETIHLDGVTIEAGLQTLDGNQSEKFVRYRGYNGADLARLEMQRLFMASMLSQFLGTSKLNLATLVPSLIGDVSTDLVVGEIVTIGSKVLELSSENIVFTMVPGESTYVNTNAYGNQSVYSVHLEPLAEIVNRYFRYDMDPITSSDLGIPEISNTINNYDDAGGTVDEITGNDSSEGGIE